MGHVGRDCDQFHSRLPICTRFSRGARPASLKLVWLHLSPYVLTPSPRQALDAQCKNTVLHKVQFSNSIACIYKQYHPAYMFAELENNLSHHRLSFTLHALLMTNAEWAEVGLGPVRSSFGRTIFNSAPQGAVLYLQRLHSQAVSPCLHGCRAGKLRHHRLSFTQYASPFGQLEREVYGDFLGGTAR